MTKTTIDRKTAEAARRRVMQRDACSAGAVDSQRAEDVKLWNDFCSQEQARLDVRQTPVGSEPYAALWGG
jgi:hypothetical protein